MPELIEWQQRPLSEIYPVVFFDGIYYKVRKDSKVVNKCVYSVLGIDEEGKKDILGIWIGENESAAFWTTIFNELKNRGVKDILIACHDNLSGFSNALSTVFPKTENQLCIIHMIRNSTKFVSYKDIKPIMADLKKVYVITVCIFWIILLFKVAGKFNKYIEKKNSKKIKVNNNDFVEK